MPFDICRDDARGRQAGWLDLVLTRAVVYAVAASAGRFDLSASTVLHACAAALSGAGPASGASGSGRSLGVCAILRGFRALWCGVETCQAIRCIDQRVVR